MHDILVYQKLAGLHIWMKKLEDKYFCSRDNAYMMTDGMSIPYSVAGRCVDYHGVNNFHLYQLQIRTKISFGRLITKWRIFWNNISYSTLKNRE